MLAEAIRLTLGVIVIVGIGIGTLGALALLWIAIVAERHNQ